MNEAQPWAEAVAIKDGRFLVVGSNAEWETEGHDRVDLDLPAELVHHPLHSVTDSEHRDVGVEQPVLRHEGALAVDRVGATGENQPAHAAPAQAGRRRVVGQDFAVSTAMFVA